LQRQTWLKNTHTRWSLQEKTISNSLLEELKKPCSAQDLTANQEQRRSDLALAKTVWNDALAEFREEKTELAKKAAAKKQEEESDGEKDSNGEEDNVKEPFPFLELPGEIRSMIYDLSLKDDATLCRTRSRPCPIERVERTRNIHGSKGMVFVRRHTKLVAKRGPIEYTQEQKDQEPKLKALLTKHTKRRLNRAHEEHALTVGTVKVFERY